MQTFSGLFNKHIKQKLSTLVQPIGSHACTYITVIYFYLYRYKLKNLDHTKINTNIGVSIDSVNKVKISFII